MSEEIRDRTQERRSGNKVNVSSLLYYCFFESGQNDNLMSVSIYYIIFHKEKMEEKVIKALIWWDGAIRLRQFRAWDVSFIDGLSDVNVCDTQAVSRIKSELAHLSSHP